jgi:hypothetical protein
VGFNHSYRFQSFTGLCPSIRSKLPCRTATATATASPCQLSPARTAAATLYGTEPCDVFGKTVTVNVCANEYDENAQSRGPPTLWLTVTRRSLATASTHQPVVTCQHSSSSVALHNDWLRPNPTSPNPETPRESTSHLVTDCLTYHSSSNRVERQRCASACLPYVWASYTLHTHVSITNSYFTYMQ